MFISLVGNCKENHNGPTWKHDGIPTKIIMVLHTNKNGKILIRHSWILVKT